MMLTRWHAETLSSDYAIMAIPLKFPRIEEEINFVWCAAHLLRRPRPRVPNIDVTRLQCTGPAELWKRLPQGAPPSWGQGAARAVCLLLAHLGVLQGAFETMVRALPALQPLHSLRNVILLTKLSYWGMNNPLELSFCLTSSSALRHYEHVPAPWLAVCECFDEAHSRRRR